MMETQLLKRIQALEQWRNQLVLPETGVPFTTAVSRPPTDAELDTAFGTPAEVGAGFVALGDQGGLDSFVYLIASNGTSWWHVLMTKAV